MHRTSASDNASDLYSNDPYRTRRKPLTKNQADLKRPTVHYEKEGRAHSYLPYTNHPPDLTQSRNELYVEDDATLASNGLRVDLVDHDDCTKHEETVPAAATMRRIHIPLSSMSLAEELWRKRRHHQEPACCCRCTTRTLLVLCLVIFFALTGVTTFLCWPRPPHIQLEPVMDTFGDPAEWGPDLHPWLRARWQVNLTVTNTPNFVPTRINQIDLLWMDAITQKQFAWATLPALVLQPRAERLLNTVFTVDYESPSLTDPTFVSLYNACGPHTLVSASPTLNITMQVTFHIAGLLWTPSVTVHHPPDGMICPSS